VESFHKCQYQDVTNNNAADLQIRFIY
jgi:hypothetical protein